MSAGIGRRSWRGGNARHSRISFRRLCRMRATRGLASSAMRGDFAACRRRHELGRDSFEWSHQPPAPYVQPGAWARFTPHFPDGTIAIRGSPFAVDSLAASSALTPGLPASVLLWTCSAVLHAPTTTFLATSRSIACARRTLVLGRRNAVLIAGGWISRSVILSPRVRRFSRTSPCQARSAGFHDEERGPRR